MKKTIAVILAAVLCVCSLTACSSKTGAKVNGTKIDKGVCLYLQEEAKRKNPKASAEALSKATDAEIAEYVAVNSAFRERKLSLSAAQKQKISENVNALWHLFADYYTELGIDKQDLDKVESEKAAKDAVLLSYYAEDGDEPLAEAELHAFFNANYVSFQSVTGFLTTVDDKGETVPLDEAQKQKMLQAFQNAATAVNGGEMIESAAKDLQNTMLNIEPVLRFKGTSEADQQFFAQAAALENGQAAAFTVKDYILLVRRTDINENDGLLYEQNRAACLKNLKGDAFEKVLDNWEKSYTVDR